MLLKLLILIFVALIIGRLFFVNRLRHMGKSIDRLINIFIVAITIALILQGIVLYTTF